MGKRMSARLVDPSHDVFVFDVNAAATEALVDQGAQSAASPAEAATDADYVLTSLPNAKIIESVYLGEDGILQTLRPGAIAIDFSTVDPLTSRKIAEATSEKEAFFLDAPVSRGIAGAENGTLAIMVGGEKRAFDQAQEVLTVLGSSITHVGESGTGAMVKLCNNMISAIITAATGEVMVVGREVGLDTRTMYDVLSNSSAASHMLSDYFPRTVFGEERPVGFTLDLMMKDVDLFLNTAETGTVPLHLSSAARQVFRAAKSQGMGAKDSCHVVEMYEAAADQQLRF